MKHIELLTKVTDWLDQLIDDQGHYLFMFFAYACFALIAWILLRKRRPSATPNPSVVVIPFQMGPRREQESESEPPPLA